MRARLLAAAAAAMLAFTGCTGAPPPAPAPSTSAAPASGAPTPEQAAAAWARQGAREAAPVASAPITTGELAGGTFHVFSVRATDASTRLEYVVTHPSVTQANNTLKGANRVPLLPVLTAGGVEHRVTEFQRINGWGVLAVSQFYVAPTPHPLFASYAPLPADVTSVQVSTPLIEGSLTVPVQRGAEPVPAGTPDLPSLGRAVYGDNRTPAQQDPLIVNLHGVRRLDGVTAIYYSVTLPEGAPDTSITYWGGSSTMLSRVPTIGDSFAATFGILDRAEMVGYSQYGGPNRTQRCDDRQLNKGLGAVAKVCWALLPPVTASTTKVDVVVGGLNLVQDVPVSDGPMAPHSAAEVPELGSGWPVIPAESIAAATAKSLADSTAPLRDVAKQGAITTSGEQLDLDTTVLFDYNSAQLSAGAQGVLAQTAQQVRATGRTGVVSVTGHTDSEGPDAANRELSKRRAQAVADALAPLLGGGFSFAVEGKGESEPAQPNDTEAGRAANRRVTVLPPPG